MLEQVWYALEVVSNVLSIVEFGQRWRSRPLERQAYLATAIEWLENAPDLNQRSHVHPWVDALRSGDVALFLTEARDAGVYRNASYEWGEFARQLQGTRHSSLRVEAGAKPILELGRSLDTRVLEGQCVPIRPVEELIASLLVDDSRDWRVSVPDLLPTFRITMVGPSGSGKTTYMGLMYAALSANAAVPNAYSVTVRAIDPETDLILGKIADDLYDPESPSYPPATDLGHVPYEFELQLNGVPAARVDWVDYRGALVEDELQAVDVPAFHERLRASHAVMVFVDLSRLKGRRLDTLQAVRASRLQRMVNLCKAVMHPDEQPRSWVFVCPKADLLGAVDRSTDSWRCVMNQFHSHVERAVSVQGLGRNAKAALVTTSVTASDDPYHVEWPLLIALKHTFLSDYTAGVGELHDRYRVLQGAESALWARLCAAFGMQLADVEARRADVDACMQRVRRLRRTAAVLTGAIANVPAVRLLRD